MRKSDGQVLLDRFWAKVEKLGPDDCWEWKAARFLSGYGRFKAGGRDTVAHLWCYELTVGKVPAGLELDHLCRNRSCVNPSHLEPVTHRENMMRGETITAANARKTHCKNGHPLSGDNLLIRKNGSRRCRACEKATQKRRRNTDAYRQKHAAQERARRRIRGLKKRGPKIGYKQSADHIAKRFNKQKGENYVQA